MLRTLALAVAGVLATFAQFSLACHAHTPTELLYRPLMRGPIMTRASSAANQWAGRTTVASGSATQVVSTTNVNSDSIINLNVQVSIPAAYSTLGRVAIASGTSTGTASTTAVYSGQVIALAWESPNAITSGQALRVDSIVGGVSFAVATSNSLTTIASGAVAMWRISQAMPRGLQVNTINPGNYFVLGWSDGVAKPIDVTAMWEIRRTS